MSVNEEESEEEEGRKHIIDQYKEELESKNGRCEFLSLHTSLSLMVLS